MKKFGIGLIVIAMASVFAAFTTPHKAKSFTYKYQYIGTSAAAQDENLATNYVSAGSPSGCDDDHQEMVCFIETDYAPDGNNNPQFPGGSLDVRNSSTEVTIDHWKPEP